MRRARPRPHAPHPRAIRRAVRKSDSYVSKPDAKVAHVQRRIRNSSVANQLGLHELQMPRPDPGAPGPSEMGIRDQSFARTEGCWGALPERNHRSHDLTHFRYLLGRDGLQEDLAFDEKDVALRTPDCPNQVVPTLEILLRKFWMIGVPPSVVLRLLPWFTNPLVELRRDMAFDADLYPVERFRPNPWHVVRMEKKAQPRSWVVENFASVLGDRDTHAHITEIPHDSVRQGRSFETVTAASATQEAHPPHEQKTVTHWRGPLSSSRP